jgi:hypothetical protein
MAVMAPVMDALAYAHSRQVVHRDLKPANVLLDRRGGGLGVPKISDFGLAKILSSEGGMTKTGAMMGTLPYMAPEQFRGAKDVDARADVFALGMILWRMLIGTLPVSSDDISACAELYSGRLQLPPVPVRPQDVPPAVPVVLQRALYLDPHHRPLDAGALLAEIQGAWSSLSDHGAWETGGHAPVVSGPVSTESGSSPTVEEGGTEGILLDEGELDTPDSLAHEPNNPLPMILAVCGGLLVAVLVGWGLLALSERKADREACTIAEARDDLQGWTDYVGEYPKGRCAVAARDRIARLEWERADRLACDKARAMDHSPAWRGYMDKYPDGSCIDRARERVAELQQKALAAQAVRDRKQICERNSDRYRVLYRPARPLAIYDESHTSQVATAEPGDWFDVCQKNADGNWSIVRYGGETGLAKVTSSVAISRDDRNARFNEHPVRGAQADHEVKGLDIQRINMTDTSGRDKKTVHPGDTIRVNIPVSINHPGTVRLSMNRRLLDPDGRTEIAMKSNWHSFTKRTSVNPWNVTFRETLSIGPNDMEGRYTFDVYIRDDHNNLIATKRFTFKVEIPEGGC